MKMKKIIISFLAMTVIFVSTTVALAHPPKNITITWDKAQETLLVSAEHAVNDASKHYVLSMSILDGNNQLLTKQYTKQDSINKFSDNVLLKGMKSGTKLRVQLVCNIMGSAEKSYLVP